MTSPGFNLAMAFLTLFTCGGLLALAYVDPPSAVLAALILLPALISAWTLGGTLR